MQIIDNTDDFKKLHKGIVSPSQFHKIIAKGEMRSRRSYMQQLIDERITGISNLAGINIANNRGYKLEDIVRERYSFLHGCEVKHKIFVKHNDNVGGVPDGLIFENDKIITGLESKAYKTEIHERWLRNGKFPITHKPQVQGYIWICEVEYWDFISYDDRSDNDWFEIRVYRDDKYIERLEKQINAFVQEMLAIEESLK